jgi:hypothetical protein
MIFGDFLVKVEVPLAIIDPARVKDFVSLLNKSGSTVNNGTQNHYKGGSTGYKEAEILNKRG